MKLLERQNEGNFLQLNPINGLQHLLFELVHNRLCKQISKCDLVSQIKALGIQSIRTLRAGLDLGMYFEILDFITDLQLRFGDENDGLNFFLF